MDVAECEHDLAPAYKKLRELYGKFDDEVLKCLKDVAKAIGGRPEVKQCMKEVSKQQLGKTIRDVEDDIAQRSKLCEQTTVKDTSQADIPEQEQNTIDRSKIHDAESIDEKPISIRQNFASPTVNGDKKTDQQRPLQSPESKEWPVEKDRLPAADVRKDEIVLKVEIEREESLCSAYVDCQRSIADFSDACAVASGKIQSGKQYVKIIRRFIDLLIRWMIWIKTAASRRMDVK
ncbi:unnamed protein product [Gongylonema pulchrum]|uniref:ING domain-containing protein n=1 Tax=Gongylonema pulchrum TaxID=637853 RepID=A0A183D1N7_9BILA|nr:unnamed protein product [Gongylonema pulchrum]